MQLPGNRWKEATPASAVHELELRAMHLSEGRWAETNLASAVHVLEKIAIRPPVAAGKKSLSPAQCVRSIAWDASARKPLEISKLASAVHVFDSPAMHLSGSRWKRLNLPAQCM